MTDPRDAMKAAVEALEFIAEREDFTFADCSLAEEICDRARSALSLLRAALEAREEPVAAHALNATSVVDQKRANLSDNAAASPVAAPVEARDSRMLWLAQVRDDFRRMADEANGMLARVAADTQGDAQDDREEALGNSIRALVAGYARCSDDLPPEQRPVSMAARSAFAIVHAIFYAPQSLTPETRARLAATFAAMKEQPSDGAALCAKGPGGCVAGECGKEEKRG